VPHTTRCTATSLEDRVVWVRRELAPSNRGAVGADAIRQALRAEGLAQVPSVRTFNPILGRRGALDGRQRTRRPAPPMPRPSWTASTSSRGWSSRMARRSRCSTVSRGTAAWSAPGPFSPRSRPN
jgi:hypothetical protein